MQEWDAPFKIGGGAREEIRFLHSAIDDMNGEPGSSLVCWMRRCCDCVPDVLCCQRKRAHMLAAPFQCFCLLSSAGNSIFKREAAIVVVGDASETSYAGFTPNGELANSISVAFTAAELQMMQLGQYSSTLREARGLCKMVMVLLQQLPAASIRTSRIQFVGDNQGCISVFQHMRGQPQIVQEMKAMRLAAYKAGAELDFVWMPRESELIKLADALSKEVDTSDFILCSRPTKRLMDLWGNPTLDAFATSVDNGHKAAKWLSKYFEPGCSGVDGLRHDWSREFVWIFPPFGLVAACLKKVLEERVHCILIVPDVVGFWSPMLLALPIRDSQSLSYHAGLYRLTSRVPKEWHSNVPRHPLRAFHIAFG